MDNGFNSADDKSEFIYRDYDWLYDKFVNKGMSISEIAGLVDVKRRTIKKWLVEKNRLTNMYRIKNKKISNLQRELIIGGLLGDGHIDKRENYPIYIESHCEKQKDYLFWKYKILRDICNSPPVKINTTERCFNGKMYDVQNQYRFTTRSIYDIKPLRGMSISELIDNINDFILSIWILDDASRDRSNWSLCISRFTSEEKNKLYNVLRNKMNLNIIIPKDNRYVKFKASSSRWIDSIILKNIPNNLDVVQYKIINAYISKPENYRMVDGSIGLSLFCKNNNIIYNKDVKDYFDNNSDAGNDILSKYKRS